MTRPCSSKLGHRIDFRSTRFEFNRNERMSMRKTFLAIALILPALARAQGTIYISNLDQTTTGSASIGSDSWIAQGFYILPTDPNAYVLDSIQLSMSPASGNPSEFAVSIYSAPVGSVGPVDDLGSLTGPDHPAGAGIYTYAASGITLSSSLDYYVVATAGTPVTQGAFNWSAALQGGSQSGTWVIGGGYASSSDGSNWTGHIRLDVFQLAINATPVPEPATWVLAGLGLLLLVIRRCQPRRSTKF